MISTQKWRIGNCLKLMRELPNKYIDLVIADPPYFSNVKIKEYRLNLPTSGKEQVITDYGGWDNFYNETKYLRFMRDLLVEAYRIMKENSSIYIFCNDKYLSFIRKILSDGGLTFASTITWFKHNPPPKRIYKATFISSTEYILFAYNGRPAFNFQGFKKMLNCYISSNNYIRYGHPTQKPVHLIEHFIKVSSNEGDLVLDPFLGSGTTLEACRNTNRNCIGFEIDPQWQHLYVKRSNGDIPSINNWVALTNVNENEVHS